MSSVTHLPTDLQRRYRAILDEARAGQARVRDSDGTNFLVLPEVAVETLRRVNAAAASLASIEALLEGMETRAPAVSEYGDWSWLRVLEPDDLHEFVRDIREAIIVGVREGSTALLEEQLHAWRVTAEQAHDPQFRAVLVGGASEADFVEVRRPKAGTSGAARRGAGLAERSAE